MDKERRKGKGGMKNWNGVEKAKEKEQRRWNSYREEEKAEEWKIKTVL